ncbi:NAD-P-binding protein [Trametes coccinea BRFM310]|uniref:NAD-P-binding protein n=1 Tax=Trametes coccinea (strain BRFM310) TaxID=1353009 RepID=A0A1Y2IMT6_TRAC3|nr:NAD-P-binding protein [Trametes coccinea BRFM310]
MGSFFSKSFDPATDIPDLNGKVAVVTGGNAGIGFAIVQHLARHGAKVYMGARNEQRAIAALERLRTEGLGPGNGEVIWLKVDLSDPRDTKRAAEELMRKEKRLDILINNAALLLVPYQKSHHGIQDVVMVNYVGTYIFTRALLPLLKRTAQEPGSDIRIVAVLSSEHSECPHDVRFRDLDDFNREFAEKSFPQFLRYAFSKLMQWMFMRELQHKLEEGVPILCLGVDPGQVNTEGVRAYANSVGPILSPIYTLIANLFFAPPTKGAYGAVFAAASPVPRAREKEYKGALLKNSGAKTSASPLADKAELRRELWETTERILRDLRVEIETE